MRYTRTINPLQFEALEPKRFEDLVRQLLYDFRSWQKLEPTGRLGSDDGFDARGWEDVPMAPYVDDDGEQPPDTGPSRIWLVQCKREKSIGPSKLAGYLDEISQEDRSTLYGIIIAAPCDFSKKARDQARIWASDNRISELHVWGKAELEDHLFQPKNDNLLFAYFGLSLAIRKRSMQANLRSRTTIKRKTLKAIDGKEVVLVRDVEDEDYPYVRQDSSGNTLPFRWWVYQKPRMTFRGLELEGRRHFAYIDIESGKWDYANANNDLVPQAYSDPWRGQQYSDDPERQELLDFWNNLPKESKAWTEVYGVIRFEDILEVDEIGDNIKEHPHFFVRTDRTCSHPFSDCVSDLVLHNALGAGPIHTELEDRIEVFPSKFRAPFRTEADFKKGI